MSTEVSEIGPTASEEEGALMKRVAAGEDEAVKEFLRRFDPLIASLVARIVWNVEDQKDVCQNVRISILGAAASYSQAQSRLRTWVGLVAIRRATDYLRDNTPYLRKTDSLDQGSITYESTLSTDFDMVKADDIRKAIKVIEDLPADARAVFCLVELQDYTYEEAAKTLDIPVGTVSTRLKKARALVAVAISAPLAGCYGWGWAAKSAAVTKMIVGKTLVATFATSVLVVGALYLLRSPSAPRLRADRIPNPIFDRLIASTIYLHKFLGNPMQPGPSYPYRVHERDSQLIMETSAATQFPCRMLQAGSEVLLICESNVQDRSSYQDVHVGRIMRQGVRVRSYMLIPPRNHFVPGDVEAITNSAVLPSCLSAVERSPEMDPVATIRRVCSTHRADPFCLVPVAHHLEQQERIPTDGSDEIVVHFHGEVDAPEWNGEITVVSDSLPREPQFCRGRICDLTFRSAPLSSGSFRLTASYSRPVHLFPALPLTPSEEQASVTQDPCNQTSQ